MVPLVERNHIAGRGEPVAPNSAEILEELDCVRKAVLRAYQVEQFCALVQNPGPARGCVRAEAARVYPGLDSNWLQVFDIGTRRHTDVIRCAVKIIGSSNPA